PRRHRRQLQWIGRRGSPFGSRLAASGRMSSGRPEASNAVSSYGKTFAWRRSCGSTYAKTPLPSNDAGTSNASRSTQSVKRTTTRDTVNGRLQSRAGRQPGVPGRFGGRRRVLAPGRAERDQGERGRRDEDGERDHGERNRVPSQNARTLRCRSRRAEQRPLGRVPV